MEESIVAALRDKQLLVVLDNCEHVVVAVADLVDTVVGSCTGVSVLATSREALGVDGEDTYDVRPLAMPTLAGDEASGSLMDNDAVRLFAERARSAKRGFSLSAENATVVAEICRRLDGIPLAIELAAARLKMMSPAEVLARLDERFQLLEGGRRTVLERHQTLRGAIDWSYALLEPAEQLLFARLSVFAGGFTLEAAEDVAAGDDVEGRLVLALLGSLVAKSMVVTDDTAVGTRYRLLDTLREYASERLDELGDPARVHARHAAHFLARVEAVAPALKGPDDKTALARLTADHDNLRTALAWSSDDDPETFLRLVTERVPLLEHGVELPRDQLLDRGGARACRRALRRSSRRAPRLGRHGSELRQPLRRCDEALRGEPRVLKRRRSPPVGVRAGEPGDRRTRIERP